MEEPKDAETEEILNSFEKFRRFFEMTAHPKDDSFANRETAEEYEQQKKRRKKLHDKLSLYIQEVSEKNNALKNNINEQFELIKKSKEVLEKLNSVINSERFDTFPAEKKKQYNTKFNILEMQIKDAVKELLKNRKNLEIRNKKLQELNAMLRGTKARINKDAIDDAAALKKRMDRGTKKREREEDKKNDNKKEDERQSKKQKEEREEEREGDAYMELLERLAKLEEKRKSVDKVDKVRLKRRKTEVYVPPKYETESQYMHEELPLSIYSECIPTKSDIAIRPHQKKVIEHILKHRGLIAVHSMGSGKTLIAATAARCIMESMKKKGKPIKVIFIAPKSLMSNFKQQIRKAYDNVNFSAYDFLTFDSFLKEYSEGRMKCENSFLIIDEGHNLRTKIDLTKPEGKRAHAIIQCAKRAFKVLILTATPIVNSPNDIINLIAMVKGEDPITDAKFSKILEKESAFKEYFKCMVSFYQNPQEHFPTSTVHRVEIPMTKEYYKAYYNVQQSMSNIFGSERNLKVFYNGVRRAATSEIGKGEDDPNPKLEWVRNFLQTNRTHRIVIFAQFIEMGIMQIQKICLKLGLDCRVITGETSAEDRATIVRNYNHKKFNILLISKAGGEGIDLVETNDVILMQPGWNKSEIYQATGRAIRFKSHERLSPRSRHVNVYQLILTKPPPEQRPEEDRKIPSVDEILEDLSERKEIINEAFLENLSRVSIENVTC